MNPLLSVLIPTTPDRKEVVSVLTFEINKQISLLDAFGNVEVLIYEDDKTMTIGQKREIMYAECNGKMSVQWDSDDGIHENGIALILEAIKNNPYVDCVTYQEYVNMNGTEYKSNHSLAYGDWEGDGQRELPDGFHFHRTPFMKSVIKTEIARSVPIPHIRFGEDHQWAQALKPHLKTEVHIDQQIYRYIHNATDFNTRYGITNG